MNIIDETGIINATSAMGIVEKDRWKDSCQIWLLMFERISPVNRNIMKHRKLKICVIHMRNNWNLADCQNKRAG